MNNIQLRPTTNVVISRTDAKYYIENSTTNLEILPTSYYEIFPNLSKFTGYSIDSNLGNFFNAFNSETTEASGILGGIINSNKEDIKDYAPQSPLDFGNMKSNETAIFGQRGAENLGLAVFKNDRLVGELNGIETVCFSLISNKINSFFITVEDPSDYENFIDLNIYRNHLTKKKVRLINNTPFITIDLNLDARISSVKDNINYLNNDYLEAVSIGAKKYIEEQMYNYLYKTSKKYKSDISGFGRNALFNFLTSKDFEKFNWADNYQNAFFKVNCRVLVKSRLSNI